MSASAFAKGGKHKPPHAIKKAAPSHAPAKPATPRALAPPELLFTFDDGPDLTKTPRVLDALEKHHIHAVFFVNGVHFMGTRPNAEKARELLREEIRRGHYVGNHTVHHLFLCGIRGPKVGELEITQNADLIEQATGVRPELFRTPYGSHCPSLSATLAKLGIKHTGWDIDPQDWKVKNTVIVRDFIIGELKKLHGRAILLMHDIHDDTVEALPQILDWLDKENAERARTGGQVIKVLDYTVLLPPRPAWPPLLDGIGRLLIDAAPLVGRVIDRAVAWLAAAAATRA